MGPNTRLEAIREVESDILDSLKRLSKFTANMSAKKLQSMPYKVFTRKQAALPQFKRLRTRTIRATRDGQQLAPRLTKHDFYYRLFENFVDILDTERDRLLEIEETMDSLRDLHEFRKQTLTHTYSLNRSKIAHLHRHRNLTLARFSVLWISHYHLYHTKVEHLLQCLHPNTLHRAPVPVNQLRRQQQQPQLQCDTSGVIPTNHRHAAAVLTLTGSINTTLVGRSMTFIATSME
jgi:hypothetical protein